MANIGETIKLSGEIMTGYAPGAEQWKVGSGQQVKILNSRTQNGQLYYDVQHIGGGTGWVLASSLDTAAKPISTTPIVNKVAANKITSAVTPTLVGNQQANILQNMGSGVAKATQSLTNYLTNQQKTVDQNLAAEQAKEAEALKQIKGLTTPFREKTEAAQREKLGTDQVLADQKALLGELDQLLTEGNDLIRQQQEVTGLSAIRNPRIQKTMDDVLARAGVIEAVVNLQNTYLANAYQSIDRTISAISSDRQDRINYYGSVLQLADRNIIELTSEKRKLAEEQTSILKFNLDQGVQTANYIKELMVSPDTAMAMAKAGISLNDSVAQINAKLSTYQSNEEIRTVTNEFTAAGAQPVFDPSSVPAHLLASYTDSTGKVHYFKMSETPKSSSEGAMTADDYLLSYDLDKIISESNYNEQNNISEGNPPNFSPSYFGAPYVDPSNGDIWQYNANGWEKVG